MKHIRVSWIKNDFGAYDWEHYWIYYKDKVTIAKYCGSTWPAAFWLTVNDDQINDKDVTHYAFIYWPNKPKLV